jgi:energy-coupling factor transporter ATP-binding protein EcfA2
MTVGVIAAFLQYARRFFRPSRTSPRSTTCCRARSPRPSASSSCSTPSPRSCDDPRPLPLPAPGAARSSSGTSGSATTGPAPRRKTERAPAPTRTTVGPAGVSFRIRPGERVAVVGATGSGKSTIINLLMRFYEPQRGEILFDGVPIRASRRRAAGADRAGAPGRLPLQRGCPLQHRARPRGDHARSGRRGGGGWARPPSSPAARRLRAAARRARRVALRGRAPARLLRPRARLRPAGAGARRGDQLRRQRARGADRRGAGRADARAHLPGRRAPALHRPERRPDPGPAPRRDPRARHPRRAARGGRALQPAARAAVRAGPRQPDGAGMPNRPA